MPPVSDWIKLVSTEKDMAELLTAVQGIPPPWLEWSDKQTQSIAKRNREIGSRVGYSLTTLWNGITLLQECKFLCDVLENAFRFGFIGFVSLNEITYGQLYPKKYLAKFRGMESKVASNPTAAIEPAFILETTFEQLSRTMSLNWERIDPIDAGSGLLNGFRQLFWDEVHLRDLNLFTRDMATIRHYRNDIAHSKRLFTSGDVNRINELVRKWLKPLNVQLMQKVHAYRRSRPRFLYELGELVTD